MNAPALEGQRCPAHGAAAIGNCERCGVFICAADATRLDTHVFCRTCAARPDVDYLEAYRLAYWGRRDGWAWFLGLSAVLNLVIGLGVVVNGVLERTLLSSLPLALWFEVFAVICAGFWWGVPLARWGVLGALLVAGLFQVMAMGPSGFVVTALQLAVVGSGIASVRNRLFFKLDVSREALRRAWSLEKDNRLARSATALGVLGLFVPGFGALALVCGVIALRRVDPLALPPVGNKGYAVAGVILGSLTSLLWGAVLLISLLG